MASRTHGHESDRLPESFDNFSLLVGFLCSADFLVRCVQLKPLEPASLGVTIPCGKAVRRDV